MISTPVTSVDAICHRSVAETVERDLVAVEAPLQIVLDHGSAHRRISIPWALLMRSPGADEELVRGFLHTQGVTNSTDDLLSIRRCDASRADHDVWRAVLANEVRLPAHLGTRALLATSACGVCGSYDAQFHYGLNPVENVTPIDPHALRVALEQLRNAQPCFRHTGGMHAAGAFDHDGALIAAREDVGRHNALDKLIGSLCSLAPRPTPAFILMSSRASFELVQKTIRARVGILATIGAPSSFAIEMAARYGITLLGFVGEERFNVYTHATRLTSSVQVAS